MTRLSFNDWIDYGLTHGYASQPHCAMHDGLPLTESEAAVFEDGTDPCMPAVRLHPDAVTPPA